jgi:hypothetical protein
VKLPSDKTLVLAMMDVREIVHQETDVLWRKCQANAPDAIGYFQEGSNSAVAGLANIKGNKPHGPAVLFHTCPQYQRPKPKQYITYENGRWDGVLATWNGRGQKEFWGNYSNGQRNGFCCLFRDDALITILECTRNKAEAVHLVTANEVARSWTDVDAALADTICGPMLRQVDEIERRMKEEDRELRDRLRNGVQRRVGDLNRQKRAAASARGANRAAGNSQAIQGLRRAGGL